MYLIKTISLLVVATTLFSGCLKDEKLPKKIAPLDLSVGVPIVNSKLTVANAINKNETKYQLIINADKYYSFLFSPGKQQFPKAEEFIVLKDIDLDFSAMRPNVDLPANAPSTTCATCTKNNITNVPYPTSIAGSGNNNLNGAELKKISYKGGTLTTQMKSTYNGLVKFNLIIPSFTKANIPLKIYFELDGSSSSINNVSKTTDLTGYDLDLTANNVNNTNKVNFDIEFVNVATSPTAGVISVERVNFSDQKWSRINGKLGTVEIPVTNNPDPNSLASNSIYLPPFDNNDNDKDSIGQPTYDEIDFSFKNPQMYGKLYSSFGFPVSVKIKPIEARGINGQFLLAKDGLSYPLNRFILGSSPIPELFTINGTNVPDFGKLFQKGPREIKYSMFLNLNATNNNSSDFVLDSSRISADVNLDLPLYGYFKLFNLKETTENPIYQTSQATNFLTIDGVDFAKLSVKQVLVRFAYESTMPVGLDIQVEFLNVNKQSIAYDSKPALTLFDPNNRFITNAAPVGANGFSNGNFSTIKTPFQVLMNQDKFEKIKNEAKFIRIIATMSSYNIGSKTDVKIRPEDYIIIRLSAGLDGSLVFNNN